MALTEYPTDFPSPNPLQPAVSITNREPRQTASGAAHSLHGREKAASKDRRMIRKESSEGIGYSVVELNDVRHVMAAAVPRSAGSFDEQAHDALKTIEAVAQEEGTQGSIVKQAVFLKDIGQLDTCRKIMKDFYGKELPATAYIAQAPCEGKEIAIEAMGVGRGKGDVQILRCSEKVVVTRHNDISFVHCAPVFPETSATGVYDRSLNAFHCMANALKRHGYHFNQIIRTWLYLGDIVGPERDTQRYIELNRARSDLYQNYRFAEGRTPPEVNGTVYPASTGIGSDGRGILMSCIALETSRDDVKLVPLENPVQTSAFDYGKEYGRKSPKFARAMAVTNGHCATIFVSGTASITGSETQFIEDIEGQTGQTLDNIAALIGEDNFRRHGTPGIGATLDDLALVRVYIKRQEDFEKTRAVCQQRLGELPIIYAVGDVCRPDLLVEIEGMAFSQQGQNCNGQK